MNKKIKVSSNKSFGIVFFIFFIAVAFYPLVNNEEYRLWALIISLVFLILDILYITANKKLAPKLLINLF